MVPKSFGCIMVEALQVISKILSQNLFGIKKEKETGRIIFGMGALLQSYSACRA